MMLRSSLPLALLASGSAADSRCKSDLDCALNGVCTTGRCVCDAAWEGQQCERFAFLPGPVDADVNSPWATPDLETSTWGLGTLQRPVDGEQHMFGTELTGSCGIGAWQTNSATVHWVSRTPKTGPWQRKDVALPAQATCASTARAPNGTLIMLLFGGTRSTPKERVPKNYPKGDPVHHMFCHNGSTPCGFSKHGCVERPSIDRPFHDASLGSSTATLETSNSLPDCAHCKGTACLTTGCSFPMYVADAPTGPWRNIRANLNTMVAHNPLNFTGQFSIAAPWIASNGTTTTILQTGDYNNVYPASLRLNNIGAVIRADRFEGPYTVIARNACGPGEDMYIWQDTRGHWHCVWHNTGHTSINHGHHQDGGHAFSIDGRDPWFCVDGKGGHGLCTPDTPAPYNTTLWHTMADGSVTATVMGTRERPHMMFNADGSPLALVTAVRYCNGSNVELCASDVPPGYSDRSFTSVALLRQQH